MPFSSYCCRHSRLCIFLLLLASPIVRTFEFPFLSFKPATSRSTNAANAQKLLTALESRIQQAPKNGINTPPELGEEIVTLCEKLEKCNPTPRPVRNEAKMNGFWKMLWTNFEPVAPSSGKLGPFIGDVYQDIDFVNGVARNILRIDFPPIMGELMASASIVSDSTMAITFETVGNNIAGKIPLGPKIKFEANKEIRLWEHVYLDDEIRVLYARRQEDTSSRGFLYVMQRADDERFETNV